MLIGSVTGEDPGHYMRDNIFEPLGMKSTYWYESQEGPAPWWPLNDCGGLGDTIGTDGAAITTIEDMDSFYRGLFGEELFSSQTLQQMLNVDSQVFGFRYGIGILEMVNDSYPDDLLYGFGGDGASYKTAAFHDPTKSRTVVVFTAVGSQQTLLWEAIDWANQQTN
jgi:CubicO group peptidase (beta-lactamase class C family)